MCVHVWIAICIWKGGGRNRESKCGCAFGDPACLIFDITSFMVKKRHIMVKKRCKNRHIRGSRGTRMG